jgi:putative salt-induced outer membrane protein
VKRLPRLSDFIGFFLVLTRGILFICASFFMRAAKIIALATVILAMFLPELKAQSNVVTLTNYVTVEVTNVVTDVVTNVVTNVVTITNVVPPVAALPAATNTATVVVKYPWESAVSAGLTMTRGNSRTLLYTGDFKTDKKTPENEFHLKLDGAYGSQDSQANVNNYGGTAQWNHLFTERFYAYLRTDALRDLIADLSYRVNVGPGIGYYFIKNTNTSLAFEIGGTAQFQHLGNDFDEFGTLRFAEKFEHKFNDHARLWQNVEMLPQVDQLANSVINFEAGIETTITKTFGLKTYLDDTYQSQPATGRLRNDLKLVSAVYYKF